MRPELKRIEIIERYLNNDFTEKEKTEFEDRLKKDPNLKQEVDSQRDLIETVKRQGLRQSVQRAKKSYHIQKSMKWIIGSILIIGALTVFIFVQQKMEWFPFSNNLKTEKGQNSAIYVPEQEFQIENKEALVLEGKQGLVLAIPEEAFEDSTGNLVTENVTILLKEALDAETILKSGLSTMADSNVLETAGMFEIKAIAGDNELRLRKGKEILVNVPTDERLEGMKLYDGEKLPNGTVNWVNPKPIENYLIPEDILTLNFYRPAFMDSLHHLGKDTLNKEYVDSLFYSFYCDEVFLEYFALDTLMSTPLGGLNENSKVEKPKVNKPSENSIEISENSKRFYFFRRTEPNWYQSSIISENDKAFVGIQDSSAQLNLGKCSLIWPADIKAFWNEEFQGSNLATKEFESRMKFLTHKKALNVYVENLDKPLFYSDSLLANGIVENCNKEKFKSFYARKDGQVKVKNEAIRKLASYYKLRREIYAKNIKESQEKFWKKQSESERKRLRKVSQNNSKNLKTNAENLRQEFNESLKEANKKMGIRYRGNNPNKGQYRTLVRTLGWKNLDRPVVNVITIRRKLSPSLGENMKLEYNELKVEVDNVDSYDRIYCYMVSRSEFSFRRMIRKGANFESKTNAFFNYKIITVAYKNDQAYFGMKRSPKDTGLVRMDLKQLSSKELTVQLKAYARPRAASDMLEDLKFKKFLIEDNKRRKVNQSLIELKRNLIPLFTNPNSSCIESGISDIQPVAEGNYLFKSISSE